LIGMIGIIGIDVLGTRCCHDPMSSVSGVWIIRKVK